jgi:predicted DNA-binding protein
MNARLTQVIPDELHDRLEILKDKIGMSKNSIVNAAIEEYIRTRNTDTLEKRVTELEKKIIKLEQK